MLNETNGRIAYRFHARDLHLVMWRTSLRTSVRFRVLLDGEAPGAAYVVEVDQEVLRETQCFRMSGSVAGSPEFVELLGTEGGDERTCQF
jgi:hypothetical protein